MTEMTTARRVIGIDLGIASAHTVRVRREDGSLVCARRCEPNQKSMEAILQVALAGAEAQTRVEVVFEPTGPAWLPVAVFFASRGATIYRVSSAQSADLRSFLSRHAKSNRIDADALAWMPLIAPWSVTPLQLPGPDRASLDRRVRVTDRLTRLASTHKVRIKALVRSLLPMSPLKGDLSQSDVAVLQRTGADPHRLLGLGPQRLTDTIRRVSNGHQGRERADEWLEAAHLSLELYQDSSAVPFSDLAAEVETEVRLLLATLKERAPHERVRELAYRQVDPCQLARSLPGVATISAPALVSLIGDPHRFPDGAHLRSFTGLTAKASETGESDRKGGHISKAGPNLLRATLIGAADTARKLDPQLARLYYVQMVERGACHNKALCVVAAHLAERVWSVLLRGTPYQICDVDGTAISAREGRDIVSAHWTVPEEVRRRRRSKKSRGKVPQQVLAGHVHGRSVASTRRPSPPPMLGQPMTSVKDVLETAFRRAHEWRQRGYECFRLTPSSPLGISCRPCPSWPRRARA